MPQAEAQTQANHTAVPPAAPASRMSGPLAAGVAARVGQAVVGQEVALERLMIALLTGGHVLLEGVPGLAKTLLVQTLASAVELDFARVQFTIDLLPGDLTGSEILDPRTNDFRTRRGPVFTNLLLADEINRAAPKVQSALLEAMQERRVTIGNETHNLPVPFVVVATQNPVEQAGTFELPEAQLDRFLLRHRLTYPKVDEEQRVLQQSLGLGLKKGGGGGEGDDEGAMPMTAFDIVGEGPVATRKQLVEAMQAVQKVHVSDVFTQHALSLVRRTRGHERLELGASPRAGIALVIASRARAFLHGRDYVVPEDLLDLADDVLLHRIRPTYAALAEGWTTERVLASILDEMM